MLYRNLLAALGLMVVIAACCGICIMLPRGAGGKAESTAAKASQTQHDRSLNIPLVDANKEILSYVSSSWIEGQYRSSERCDRDCTDDMMRRAEVIDALYKKACNKQQLDEVLMQAAGKEFNFSVAREIDGLQWKYYLENYTPVTKITVDWVRSIKLVTNDSTNMPENIVSIRFGAPKIAKDKETIHRFMAEIYSRDMAPDEVERAAFNENGELVAYSRFKRSVGLYVVLLDKMKIQDKLCITF